MSFEEFIDQIRKIFQCPGQEHEKIRGFMEEYDLSIEEMFHLIDQYSMELNQRVSKKNEEEYLRVDYEFQVLLDLCEESVIRAGIDVEIYLYQLIQSNKKTI